MKDQIIKTIKARLEGTPVATIPEELSYLPDILL